MKSLNLNNFFKILSNCSDCFNRNKSEPRSANKFLFASLFVPYFQLKEEELSELSEKVASNKKESKLIKAKMDSMNVCTLYI